MEIGNGEIDLQQWYELDEQFLRTPAEPFSSECLGECMKLIALLNRFGYQPMSKQQALNLAMHFWILAGRRRRSIYQADSFLVVHGADAITGRRNDFACIQQGRR